MKTRWLITVFGVALAIRLLAWTFILPQLAPSVDLDDYRSLARNLADGRGFCVSQPNGEELPSLARTPVYPAFLACLIRFWGDHLEVFLAAQCLFGAATCGLTVMLARRWLSSRLACGAGLLVAFDPNSVIRCLDLRTETLFTFLLLLGMLGLAASHKRGWFAAGVLWGVAALCRPIGIWLWVLGVGVALIRKPAWGSVALFVCSFMILTGSWMARNAILTGRPFISTIATYNLLMYRAAGIEAERGGTTLEAVQKQWMDEFCNLQWFEGRLRFEQCFRQYRVTAVRVIAAHPVLAIRQAIVGWGKMLLGPGARSLEHSLHSKPPSRSKLWPACYIGLLVMALMAAVGGLFRMKRDAMLMLMAIVYFVILSGGPEANSRFRTPITPMIAILAMAYWRRT